jgi:SAM-dependent methyltransferase
VPYDPLLYSGSAPHYVRGRPPYSAELAETVRAELDLDGTGRLLDVGCGPGPLALALAPLFAETIGVDPDAEMLAEAERLARERGHANVRFVRGLAEELGSLVDGRFRAVSFGQSFHRVERERVAEWVYDALEPGGALVLVAPIVEGRPVPASPGPPSIPHAALVAIVERYLGARRRSGSGFSALPQDRWEDVLAGTRFAGSLRTLFCPGVPDLIRDAEEVLSGYLSLSWCAPHLFGDRLAAFAADVRAELGRHSPDGRFWDWPGDTEVMLAIRRYDAG